MTNNHPKLSISNLGFDMDNDNVNVFNNVSKKLQNTFDLKYNYHKQIFQSNKIPNYKPIDSILYVKSNDKKKLVLNLVSSVFDNDFDSKEISNIKLVKKSCGSVDFIITFKNKNNPQKSIFDLHYIPNIKSNIEILNKQI